MHFSRPLTAIVMFGTALHPALAAPTSSNESKQEPSPVQQEPPLAQQAQGSLLAIAQKTADRLLAHYLPPPPPVTNGVSEAKATDEKSSGVMAKVQKLIESPLFVAIAMGAAAASLDYFAGKSQVPAKENSTKSAVLGNVPSNAPSGAPSEKRSLVELD